MLSVPVHLIDWKDHPCNVHVSRGTLSTCSVTHSLWPSFFTVIMTVDSG